MSIQNRIDNSIQAAKPRDRVGDMITKMMPQIAKALPAHLEPRRFARLLLTEFRKTPKLLQCDSNSLLGSMMEIARLGLEFGDNTVHLIPYGKNVEVVIGYKGFIELAYRTGIVLKVESRVVYEGDEFVVDYQDPVHPVKTHVPKWKSKQITHVWARAQGKDGQFWYEVLCLAELNELSKNRKGPWQTHPSEMARKTAIRRLSKQLPQSPELAAARRIDDGVVDGLTEDVATVFFPDRNEDTPVPVEEIPAFQRKEIKDEVNPSDFSSQ
tara:strand:+ start:2346 stop:3152 length:807 start_codon:yes stop_codon:yes gene_type:complete